MPSTEDYRTAGLYDPEVDVDSGRMDLLRWLEDQGFTIDEMVHAKKTGDLQALASDRALVPSELLTRAEAIELSGLEGDWFDVVSTAFGYVPIGVSPPGEIGYTRDDVATFSGLGSIATIFSPEEALGLVRVFGASITRMAEASVSLFLSEIESRHIAAHGTELELALKSRGGIETLDGLMARLDPIMRRQVMQTVERTRRATIDSDERFVYRYAIGFVDLVGFTSLSGEMEGPELAAFLRDFEGRAFDVVTKAGARVVKLIGDEVMFAATDPADACDAARGLMEAFSSGGIEIRPRGGLAHGHVLVRGGDYYGPVVNLASRLADEAVPREVLVSDAFADAAAGLRFAAAGRRSIRGFSEPVRVWSLEP
jgi:adenylate cyclase